LGFGVILILSSCSIFQCMYVLNVVALLPIVAMLPARSVREQSTIACTVQTGGQPLEKMRTFLSAVLSTVAQI
jgi:hypothetical protein